MTPSHTPLQILSNQFQLRTSHQNMTHWQYTYWQCSHWGGRSPASHEGSQPAELNELLLLTYRQLTKSDMKLTVELRVISNEIGGKYQNTYLCTLQLLCCKILNNYIFYDTYHHIVVVNMLLQRNKFRSNNGLIRHILYWTCNKYQGAGYYTNLGATNYSSSINILYILRPCILKRACSSLARFSSNARLYALYIR